MLTFFGILLFVAAYTAVCTLIYRLGLQTSWFDDLDGKEMLVMCSVGWPISIPIGIFVGVIVGTVLGTSLLIRKASGGRI